MKVLLASLLLSTWSLATDAPTQPPPAIVQACVSDALQLCAAEVLVGDHVRIGVCMRRQAGRVSETCRVAVAEWRRGR